MMPEITLLPSWQISFLYLYDLQISTDMVISPFCLANLPIRSDHQTSPKKSHSDHKTNRKRSGHATSANRLHCPDLQIFPESSLPTV